MSIDFRDTFRKMVGGNEDYFFHQYWRKRTLFTESGLPHLGAFYGYKRFLKDYRRVAFHKATILVAVDEHGNRGVSRLNEGESLDKALDRGMSIVVQALLLPGNLSRIPRQWRWFMTLHHALCDYLLPGFASGIQPGGPVAALDIFCTSSETCSGGHYDTGDVFYFMLDGEKEWTVELVPDVEMGLRLATESGKCDLPPRREHMKVCVRPGDCLYVPPYTYHRVCSHGESLAVSVGLPTFTEMTLLRSSLVRLQKEGRLCHPLPSFPRTQGPLFHAAEEETGRRLLDALGLLEGVLIASNMPIGRPATRAASEQ